jgi:hypothetical protein
VQSGGDVINGLGFGDHLARLLFAEATRIGKLCEVAAILFQVADGLFAGDGNHQDVAAFIAFACVEDFDARALFGKRAKVFVNAFGVGQLLWHANVVAQHVLRRGHARDFRQMIDKRADELRLCRPFFDRPGKVFVHLLFRLLRESRRGQQKQQQERTRKGLGQGHRRASLKYRTGFLPVVSCL